MHACNQSVESNAARPTSGPLLRLWQIIGSPGRGVPPLLPVSRTRLYQLVAEGTFPAPIKIGTGSRSSFWRSEDVAQFLDDLGGEP